LNLNKKKDELDDIENMLADIEDLDGYKRVGWGFNDNDSELGG